MKTTLNSEEIMKELHSDYDFRDVIDRQILAVEEYLNTWTEKTPTINRQMPIAYLKNAMESTCIDSVDDRAILYVLLKRDFQTGKVYGDHCANLKFSSRAIKDSLAMKKSGASKIYPQKYENMCLQDRWKTLLDSKAEKRQRARNCG